MMFLNPHLGGFVLAIISALLQFLIIALILIAAISFIGRVIFNFCLGKCLWHRKQMRYDTGKYHYLECSQCGNRFVEDIQPGCGYQPLNVRWLTGGEWQIDDKPPQISKSPIK